MASIGQTPLIQKHRELVSRGFVLTPGGYRHRSLVHYVPHGHRVRRRKQQIQLVHRSTRRIIARHDVSAPNAPIPGLGSGWITFAAWQNTASGAISQFATQWTVPDDPSRGDTGQTIFLFNALQNPGRTNLLQPVLQWGTSQAGGGSFWTISNWYIDTSGHVCHSDCLPVLPGQVLVAIISLGQKSNGLFSYVVSFQGYPTLDLTITNIEELVYAAATLEAYEIGDRKDYPPVAFTAMTNIAIAAGGTTPTLNWSVQNNSTVYGEHSVIASSANPGGQINIYY